MPYPVHWTSLSIGYESVEDDTFADKPPLQTTLEKLLRYSAILRWANGGHTPIGSKPTEPDHRWVAEVLAYEINNELIATGNPAVIVCRSEDLCMTVPKKPIGKAQPNALLHAAATEGGKDVHTRCILKGDRWFNERSYRLCQDKGGKLEPWQPCAEHTGSTFLIATLTWPCHPIEREKIREQITQPFI